MWALGSPQRNSDFTFKGRIISNRMKGDRIKSDIMKSDRINTTLQKEQLISCISAFGASCHYSRE
jgi:hypothetical protein